MIAALKRYRWELAIAGAALVIAWLFCATTLAHTRPMGLPLDDSYIYLTYAKQFGRAQPFTYFPGGGYSAGSTSVLWPMVLAPFWTLGARGHALVWVSFGMCAVLYAAVCVGAFRLAREISGEAGGLAAAVLTLAIAPFAWTSLSGMEVAFASALIVAMLILLHAQPKTGPPTVKLALCLAAASLSRPEATLLVVAIVGVAVINRRRDLRAALWWLAPLAAPALWLAANKLFAGNMFPNTGVAKSHFYLPGFDWTYWWSAVTSQTGKMFKALFWDSASPLPWPKLVALLWLAGAVRVIAWARATRQGLVGAVLVASPLVLILAVIASSGMWNFQNYRYIAPAFPLIAVTAGIAVGAKPWPASRFGGIALLAGIAAVLLEAAPQPALYALFVAWAIASIDSQRYTCSAILVGLAAWYGYTEYPNMKSNMRIFAQGAMDTNTQVATIGKYIHDKLPEASIMFHDAGAIAYYGDGRVYDMLGLVTNYQAGIANNGAGARFEFLEELAPEQRPTHFAYYPGWLGQGEMYGEVLLHTPLLPGFEPTRLAGDADMEIIAASWDHVHTGERPLDAHDGWRMVDRLDIASLASERAHAWRGALGRRSFGDPTARWSIVGREAGARGLVVDGGRTIRGGREDFAIALDPAKPARLILRTGGQKSYPWHETIDRPVTLKLLDDRDRVLGEKTIAVPDGNFAELAFELPAGTSTQLHTEASAPYRAFHWFALQPE